MPLDLPAAPGFTTAEFGLETNTQRFESPLTKAVQRVKLGGDRWTLTATLPRMNRTQAAPWVAFFLSLQGSFATFNGFDPDCKTPRGSWGGMPLVKGGGQTGSTLLIDGLTAGVSKVARAGDYFTVGGELKQLTADADSDGSGEATLSFQPPLRNSPADNAPLTVTRASCTMALVDDMQAKWRCDKNGIYEEKTFAAVEVFS